MIFFLSAPFLEPTMLDDTNLFYSHQDIKELFRVVNSELEKVCGWFNANKDNIYIYIYIYIFICIEIGMIYLWNSHLHS